MSDNRIPRPAFRIGDSVTIRSYDQLKEQAVEVGARGQLYFGNHSFIINEKMKDMCGKTFKVIDACTEYDYSNHQREVVYRLSGDPEQWTWLEEWLIKNNDNYCTTQCPIGKAKAAELLKECDSIWDAVDEMKVFTKQCCGTPQCSLTQSENQPQLN